jgi:hypothetical protein
MRLQVPDVDQTEFGVPEVLEFDLWSISVDDLDELSERFGFDPMDWPDPFVGEVTLEQAGDPDAQPKPPKWRSRALVWMALRQNGFDVSWEAAGKARAFRWRPLPEPEVERGKDDTGETPSEPSGASTPQPSDTSLD